MSYCRFGEDSDVYIYPTGGGYSCGFCSLEDGQPFDCKTLTELWKHMKLHIDNGHKVPLYAFDRVNFELSTGQTIFGHPIPKENL